MLLNRLRFSYAERRCRRDVTSRIRDVTSRIGVQRSTRYEEMRDVAISNAVSENGNLMTMIISVDFSCDFTR